jgi:cell division protein ZapE
MSASDDHAVMPPDHAAVAVPGSSPRTRYDRDIERDGFFFDPAQSYAIEHIERLYDDLIDQTPRRSPGLWSRLFKRGAAAKPLVRGLYLWGSVGRGKTYLVDTFYDCLPFEAKLRIHFHSFMRKVHQGLIAHRRERDPLVRVADEWSRAMRVLCLDEFHVGDITDAMILTNLLSALFDRGVTLVATSNEAPRTLYREGLQRQRFLPAIALMERNMDVVEMSGAIDYRLRALEQAEVYYTPHDDAANTALLRCFRAVAPEPGHAGALLEIDGRQINTQRLADGVAWFTFDVICGGPRSTNDYIEIARCHHTVLISDIPAMDDHHNDAARRFINLVDEFYDRNVNLVVSAAAKPADLYGGSRLVMPFRRTQSRLSEMQSHDYLARGHISD